MNNTNMKKAAIDQIIVWIVLFTLFVGFLFFIIEYATAMKVKDDTDAVADFMARKVSLNNTDVDGDGILDNLDLDASGNGYTDLLATKLNAIKNSYFKDIDGDNDISCTKKSISDTDADNYQVIANVKTTLSNGFMPTGLDNVHSRVVVFNEDDKYEVECTLTLYMK